MTAITGIPTPRPLRFGPMPGLTIHVPKYQARERVVTLADGRRARIHTDDSGTVTHVTTDEHQDAVVRPKVVTIKPGVNPTEAATVARSLIIPAPRRIKRV